MEKEAEVQEQKAYCLDDLLQMDWETKVAPLVWFLNLDSGQVQEQAADSALYKGPDDRLPRFWSDLRWILENFYHIRTVQEIEELEEFLTRQLANIKNKVTIMEKSRARVDMIVVPDDASDANLWADIICIFLHRDDWMRQLGLCSQCKTWFKRSRRDQVYCSPKCKAAASYARRRLERAQTKRKVYYHSGRPR